MKLERYGSVVAALRNLMVWWQTLPDVDKARSSTKCLRSPPPPPPPKKRIKIQQNEYSSLKGQYRDDCSLILWGVLKQMGLRV